MRRTLCFIMMLLVVLACSSLWAQKFTGDIRGTVADPTGAVIAGATVTAINTQTGLSRTATTDAQGEFAFTDLTVGTYEVHAQQGDFMETVTKGVELHVSTTTTVNFQLKLGKKTEQVTVEANAVQVETNSAAVGEVVEGQQVRELPLNGRSFAQLTQLQPGVAAADNFNSRNKGLQAGVDFSVNGNQTTNNLFLVDGANNNDVGSNRTILIYPSIDAIAEFKMLRNSYGPEFGQASGAIINITTRSGGNAFHGSVFYFGRNDALNAYEYFASRRAQAAQASGTVLPNNGKDVLRRNDFGYSFGGPIKKDKLFFFWSQEWNYERRGQTRTACVPTAAERQGDFSQGISCGASAPTLPGGGSIIANPNASGLLLMQLMPLPNVTPVAGSVNNWSQSLTSPVNWRQENLRIDYNITPRHTVMGRYTHDNWQNPTPNTQGFWGDDPFPAVEANWSQPSEQIVAKITSAFGSSLVNEAAFAYSNNRINITVGGSDPQVQTQLTSAIPPIFAQSMKLNATALPTVAGLAPYAGANLTGIAPWKNALDIYTARDDLSKSWNKHTFKVGIFLGWDSKNEDALASTGERPGFNATSVVAGNTGNPIANLLNPGTIFSMGEASTDNVSQLRWRDYETYFGDTFRVRHNLTLEYGLRWSILAPPYAANNKMASFNPALYDPSRPASDACNGLHIVPGTNPCVESNQQFGTNFSSGTPGVSRSLVNTNYHAFAPRFGASWDPFGDGNTAVRLGVGQFYQREHVSTSFIETTNAPFALTISGVNRPLDQNVATIGTPTTSPTGGRDPRALLPNSWQWNLSVERTLAKETALEIGYVGNRGIHLNETYDINQVPDANRLACAFSTNCTSLRPYSNFNALTWWGHDASASYHSLQALFRTQYKRSQLQAAYTWSHSISVGDLTDSNGGGVNFSSFSDIGNFALDKGNSNIDRPQSFVANAVINLPGFENSARLLKGTIGGWELGAIQTVASGPSVTVYANGVTDASSGSLLNSLSGTGLNANQRPNMVPGVSCSSGAHDEYLFNPAAFTLTGFQIGTFGNAPRGDCRGAKLVNTDFALYKNWKVSMLGNERLRIQFRLELFNAFNTPQFRSFTGNNINDLMAGGRVTCGGQTCSPTNNVITGTPSINPSFGQSNSTRGGREIQYALKFVF
jgi:hypothetical protein